MSKATTLTSQLTTSRLYNSWLIESQDTKGSLKELKDFIATNFLGQMFALEQHPDFKLITSGQSSASGKNIGIEQIRELQQFLSKTSGISGYRVGVIYQADFMNSHAANSCLKILEDTPQNSYLFLIVTKVTNILPTIRSRCAKINIVSNNQNFKGTTYQEIILVLSTLDIKAHLDFLQKFAGKDRELWFDLANAVSHLMTKIIKRSIGIDMPLAALEHKLIKQYNLTSPTHLIEKFAKITTLIDNTINYDLDLRASTILLIDLFKS